MTTFYPLAEKRALYPANTKTKRTGEYRPPRKGEWYLSGAIPEAYQAPNDLTTSYHIVTLVQVVTTTIQIERESPHE